MTRRDLLLAATAASVCAAAQRRSAMAVEGYIFQQYAQSLKRPLHDVINQVLPMARAAGFRNIELNPEFFAPEMRDRVLAVLRSQGLQMPSLYVGGPMHEKEAADRTIATALELGNICGPFGCQAIVNNPDPKGGEAAKTDAAIIVQAGVHFMAETAKILSPSKKVLIPDPDAGCSLAASITPADVRLMRQKYPKLPVITYVNTSAAVKAESDICCTSANAVDVVEAIAAESHGGAVHYTGSGTLEIHHAAQNTE